MPKPTKTISSSVDTRLLDELEEQVRAAFQQLLSRAYTGDAVAQRKLARIVCEAVDTLGRLTQFRARELSTVAETFSIWPVLLSLNPQQIQHAKDELARLGVGTKAPNPTRAGQRVDPSNFWTQLAARSFDVILSNRYIVPALLAHVRGARKTRTARSFWRIKAKATVHTRPEGDIIIIPDWLTHVCPKLSWPITPTNFSSWWKAVKLLVLDYWTMYPQEYAKALLQIGQKDEVEWRRRGFALDRVKQTLRSLADLQ